MTNYTASWLNIKIGIRRLLRVTTRNRCNWRRSGKTWGLQKENIHARHLKLHAEVTDISFRTEIYFWVYVCWPASRRESKLLYRAWAPKRSCYILRITSGGFKLTYLPVIIIRITIVPSQCVRRQSHSLASALTSTEKVSIYWIFPLPFRLHTFGVHIACQTHSYWNCVDSTSL